MSEPVSASPDNNEPLKQVLPYSFAVVDAALTEFFVRQKELHFISAKRIVVTTGSVRYPIQLVGQTKAGIIAEIYARIVSEQFTFTYIEITPRVADLSPKPQLPELLSLILSLFVTWLHTDQMEMANILESQAGTKNDIT